MLPSIFIFHHFDTLILQGNLTGLLGALTETEREMISVERMDEYCRDKPNGTDSRHDGGINERHSVESEDDVDDTTATAANSYSINDNDDVSDDHCSRKLGRAVTAGGDSLEWPEQGRLKVSDLVMRYRHDLSPSLKGVNLAVVAGEKVRGFAQWVSCTDSMLSPSVSINTGSRSQQEDDAVDYLSNRKGVKFWVRRGRCGLSPPPTVPIVAALDQVGCTVSLLLSLRFSHHRYHPCVARPSLWFV